jgi:hypothetical protein
MGYADAVQAIGIALKEEGFRAAEAHMHISPMIHRTTTHTNVAVHTPIDIGPLIHIHTSFSTSASTSM